MGGTRGGSRIFLGEKEVADKQIKICHTYPLKREGGAITPLTFPLDPPLAITPKYCIKVKACKKIFSRRENAH